MTPTSFVLLLGLLASPVAPVQAVPPAAAPPEAQPAAGEAAKKAPAKEEPIVVADQAPMDPAVRKAVDSMQKFYENTRDFQADFQQVYTYKTFGRTSRAKGTMRFKKEGPSMRWDYSAPGEKVFVIAAEKVFAYDKEAKRIVVSRMSSDNLSASITFLWGQGKLDREFRITRADRKDLTDGIALELTPKVADPRFQKVFFLLDPKTYAVKETLVIDPDGSENRMTFTHTKTNSGLSNKVFELQPPADVKIDRMDG